MIHIFPTNRAVRSFYSNLPQDNQLLPKAYSIQSFFEYALHVKNKVRADSLVRTLCMQEAIEFDAFEVLHIPKNFMAFVRHEEYLFRFFEELMAEEIPFSALRGADTYALYEDHLSILETVHERYCQALESRGFYDAITLAKYATVNLEFINNAKEITLHHEGYLSNFELRIFNEISRQIPLHVNLSSTPFNKYEVNRIFNLIPKPPCEYLGILGNNMPQLIEQNFDLNITCAAFGQRSLQVGFVFDQIARFIKSGVSPENIVVVLPDESFAQFLQTYDKNRVLNFAMGLSVAKTTLYECWYANFSFYNQPNQENSHRQKRYGVIEEWKEAWNRSITYPQFFDLLKSFELESKPLRELLEKLFSRFERLFDWRGPMVFSDVLGLFLHELVRESLDDVGGGPVTVLGLLETRGVVYEGVIIPDFNDSFIPKRSQKDWFLSSALRAHAGLPDRQARENLQRHYYYRIISQSRLKAISYVENEQTLPSHFLHAFKLDPLEYDIPLLAASFMPSGYGVQSSIELPQVTHKLTSYPLSATRLKTLLTCPRQYYYRYIEKLKEAPLPHDGLDAMQVGSAVHKALEMLYLIPNDGEIFTNPAIWKSSLKANLKNVMPFSLHWELESGIWENRFEFICQLEMDRFKEGWRPWRLEESFTCKYEGFVLEGKIDRIDRHQDGRLEVLDYKTGATLQSGPTKVQNRTDFQLIFYYLLALNEGKVDRVGYYDLNQGVIAYEKNLEPSIEKLLECLRENETITNFDKTTKKSQCARCPYAQLCQRKSGWS
jgi:RecB family exonuclease